MKYKIILTTLAIILTCLTTFSCKKDREADNEQFCTLVNDQNFDATLPLVDTFLATLDGNNQEESLQKLKEWLDAKSCVNTSSILCNSCIKTLPAQSELSIEFNVNGQNVTLTLDISMGETLKTLTYH